MELAGPLGHSPQGSTLLTLYEILLHLHIHCGQENANLYDLKLVILIFQLKRATVHHPVTGVLIYSDYRISKR